MRKGKLYGIGVGPGASDLMTIRAVKVLQNILIVAVPCSAPEKESLAYQISREWINPRAEVIRLEWRMTREKITRQNQHYRAAELIRGYLENGVDVAFLAEGDIVLFSTFSYLLPFLENEFEVAIIPGISSLSASAAETGLPLVINDQSLLILPAVGKNILRLNNYLEEFETIVLMKVFLRIEEVKLVLEKSGYLNQALIVERASTGSSKVYWDISHIRNGELSYMSLMIISKNKKDRLDES